MTPQGKKIIEGLWLWKQDINNGIGGGVGGFVDETGQVFYDDGTPFGNYKIDPNNFLETPAGKVYVDQGGLLAYGGEPSSKNYITENAQKISVTNEGKVPKSELQRLENAAKDLRVYPDETSPTGYSLMTDEKHRQFSQNDWNAFVSSGKTFGTPVLKDGTPYEPGTPILPAGTDVNRLQQVLQEMTNFDVTTSTSGSPLQGGDKAQRMIDLRQEVSALTGGDVNLTNALVNQLSYRPAQQQIKQILDASQNPDTSFSLKNITNAAGRLAESVGPAIAAMAVAQYALPSLLGSTAAAFTGATETGLATLAGEGALADTVGATLLAGGQGAASAPSFTSNAMLANLGLGAEAAAPFTPASGLPANLFTIAPQVGQAGALTLGDDLAQLMQSYPNMSVDQLQSIAEINYGLNPTTAFDAANLASSGYSPATINQVLSGSYTPTELIGTGIESMQTLPTVSQIPQYPGDEQYIQQDIMEQARATNVPSGSPTSWDTGISAAITPGQILQGARLAGGLIGGAQEQPQQIQQMPRQNIVPRGQGVDYSGIYNLLGLQRPQNRFSLLG